MNYAYKPTLELRISIKKLKSAAIRGIWASMDVDMSLDEGSWIYLQEQLNLIFASWVWKCHVMRIWRGFVSCSGSLHSEDYKANTLILCRRCWSVCLYCSRNTRLSQDEASLRQIPLGCGSMAVGGSCPCWGPGAVIWGLPGTPTCRWQHLPVLWDVVPLPSISESLGKWKLKPRASPTPFLRSTFCFSASKCGAGLIWHPCQIYLYFVHLL